MTNVISEYLQHDDEKIENLIKQYPANIPVKAAAEFLDVDDESVRSAIESGSFGISWKKAGKLNRSFALPTAHFLRWYMHIS